MCMGGNSSGSDLRAQQLQQQNVTDTGMNQLNRIFDTGGTIGTGLVDPTAGFNPKGNYFTALGAPVSGNDAQGLLSQGLLFSGQTQTPGFTPDFYKQRANAYTAFANPQLTSQFQKTQQGVDYSLANQGLSKSSAASTLGGSLQKELATQRQGIADQGLQQSQQLQQQVGQEKNTLVNQLIASGNPGQSSQAALSAAGQFSAPSAFAPVGNFFNNWSSLYGASQLANAYSSYLNPAQNPYLARTPTNDGALPNPVSYN